MKKVRTIGFLKVSITNRGIYTLSLFALAAILAIFVYAVSGTFVPGSTPNPGHPPSELGIPLPCSSGQFLKYANSTVGWVCGGTWTENGTNIYNSNMGNVGIGTMTPGAKLEVNGNFMITSPSTELGFTPNGDVSYYDGSSWNKPLIFSDKLSNINPIFLNGAVGIANLEVKGDIKADSGIILGGVKRTSWLKPPVCTGTNKALQFDGTNYLCVTISTTSGTSGGGSVTTYTCYPNGGASYLSLNPCPPTGA